MNEEEFAEMLRDTIAELQGQALAQTTMLEAMVMAHPNPAALRDCWDRLSTPRIADVSTLAATKNRAADQACVYHLTAWTKRLDRHHPAASPGAP